MTTAFDPSASNAVSVPRSSSTAIRPVSPGTPVTCGEGEATGGWLAAEGLRLASGGCPMVIVHPVVTMAVATRAERKPRFTEPW